MSSKKGNGKVSFEKRKSEQFENLLRNYMLVFEKTGLFLNLHKKWFEIGHSRLYEG